MSEKVRKLDFSQAHFLDHSLIECIREKQTDLRYGGWRIHIRYWWEFKESRKLRSMTLCKLGLHEWGEGRSRPTPEDEWIGHIMCGICLKRQNDDE